ncbi:MAG: 16S rRNA (cytidine(1402)-2'-O)-methyltransferase [Psittacicella sp.]
MQIQNSFSDGKHGFLYLVSTPIGNLEDITLRALTILKSVDFIAAEDTRNAKQLLDHFGIDKKLVSYHNYNEDQKKESLLNDLLNSKNIALISDAGTPCINDPGYHLVKLCRENNINVVSIPGACAAISALSISGIASDKFCYEGFLSSKKSQREKYLFDLKEEERTLIFYESPHRIIEMLNSIQNILGNRKIVIARELTKLWETIYSGSVEDILATANNYLEKGEIVIIVEGFQNSEEAFKIDKKGIILIENLIEKLPLKEVSKIVSEVFDLNKNELYKYILNTYK